MGKSVSVTAGIIYSNPVTISIPNNGRCGLAYSTTVNIPGASRVTRFTAITEADDRADVAINGKSYNYIDKNCEFLYQDAADRAHIKCTFSYPVSLNSDTVKIDVYVIDFGTHCGLFGRTITFYYD